MEILGLLKLGGISGIVLAALVFLWKIYRVGYESGYRKGQERKLIEIAKENRELLKSLLDFIDSPNAPFRVRRKDK